MNNLSQVDRLMILGCDTETTGLLQPDHRLVEIYNGLWRGTKKVYEYEQRIDPQRGIAADAQRVHGISAQDLFGKPTWDKVAPVQAKVMSKAHLFVAHNAQFDWEFLKKEFERIGVKMPEMVIFDTMEQGVWATPDGKKPRLEELCFACGVEYDKSLAHAAKYDVDKMMECFFIGLEWGFFEIPEELRQSLAVAA